MVKEILEIENELIKINESSNEPKKKVSLKKKKDGDNYILDYFNTDYRPPDYHSLDEIELFKI